MAGQAEYALVSSYGGYTTNLPIVSLLRSRGVDRVRLRRADLAPEHGGPVRANPCGATNELARTEVNLDAPGTAKPAVPRLEASPVRHGATG